MKHAKHGLSILAATLAIGLAAAACGGRGAPGPEAQPGPDVTTFVEGEFDQLPRYPRSEPAGNRSEKAGTTAQTFRVENATAEQILDFYAGNLNGWEQVEAPHRVGSGSYRGVWQRGDRRLTVSAARAPTAGDEKEVVSQFSLSLGPS